MAAVGAVLVVCQLLKEVRGCRCTGVKVSIRRTKERGDMKLLVYSSKEEANAATAVLNRDVRGATYFWHTFISCKDEPVYVIMSKTETRSFVGTE